MNESTAYVDRDPTTKIRIDAGAGGSGKSVIQHLMIDDQYLNKNYKIKFVNLLNHLVYYRHYYNR